MNLSKDKEVEPTMSFVWFGLVCLFLFMEANTVALVSAWFACGALAAMFVSLFGGWIWLQVLVFLAVSALMLACLRPFMKKHVSPKLEKTNIDAVLGATGRVITAVDNINATGQVKIGGMEWTARSTTGEPIPEGTVVQVDRIEGVKVYVTAKETVAV